MCKLAPNKLVFFLHTGINNQKSKMILYVAKRSADLLTKIGLKLCLELKSLSQHKMCGYMFIVFWCSVVETKVFNLVMCFYAVKKFVSNLNS